MGKDLGPLAVDLARGSELLVYLESPDGDDVEAARRLASEARLLGRRVFVEKATGPRVHLAGS